MNRTCFDISGQPDACPGDSLETLRLVLAFVRGILTPKQGAGDEQSEGLVMLLNGADRTLSDAVEAFGDYWEEARAHETELAEARKEGFAEGLAKGRMEGPMAEIFAEGRASVLKAVSPGGMISIADLTPSFLREFELKKADLQAAKAAAPAPEGNSDAAA